jgi:hypothetical protein
MTSIYHSYSCTNWFLHIKENQHPCIYACLQRSTRQSVYECSSLSVKFCPSLKLFFHPLKACAKTFLNIPPSLWPCKKTNASKISWPWSVDHYQHFHSFHQLCGYNLTKYSLKLYVICLNSILYSLTLGQKYVLFCFGFRNKRRGNWMCHLLWPS